MINLESQESLDFVNPVYEMIQYLIAGLIFAHFHFNFLFFGFLGEVISTILFFLALRMVRKASRSFFYAYLISLIYLIKSIIEGILLVTPFVIPEMVNLMFFGLGLVRIYLICQGLKLFVKNKKNINTFCVYYFILSFIGIMGSLTGENSILLIIFFIIVFVLMIKKLRKCEVDITAHGFGLNLSPVRSNTSTFVGGYLAIILVMMFLSHYIYPYIIYHNVELYTPNYSQYELLNTYEKDGSHLDIYDYNENQYLYVYKFTTNHIKQPLKSVSVVLYHNMGNGVNYQITDFIISDGKQSYLSHENLMNEYSTSNAFHFENRTPPYIQTAYLEPNFDFEYTIQFALITPKTDPYQDNEGDKEYTFIEDMINIYYYSYDKILLLDKHTPNIYNLYVYETENGEVLVGNKAN